MKTRVFAFSVLFLFLITAVLSGCGLIAGSLSEKELPDANPVVMIVLVGNHSNARRSDIQLDKITQKVYSSFGNMGIVVVDGNPELLYNEETNELIGSYSADYLSSSREAYKKNPTMWEMYFLSEQTDLVNETIKNSFANDSEVDTLRALQVAAEALYAIEASMGTDVKKEITILDTGLCTSGTMSFLQPDWLALLMNERKLWKDEALVNEVSYQIDLLDEAAEIPNLSDITVTWFGLGKTDFPQPPLTNLNVQNLQYLWGEILTRSGAISSHEPGTDDEYGIFVSTSASNLAPGDCTVTPVICPKDLTEENDLKLTEEMLGFEANSSDFRPDTQVDEIILPYANNLLHYSDTDILLVGTTSSWEGGSVPLSEERAEKVCEKFVAAGVPRDRISIIGIGYDPVFCQNDAPNGNFEEEIARENRAVFILPNNSEKAQTVMDRYPDA